MTRKSEGVNDVNVSIGQVEENTMETKEIDDMHKQEKEMAAKPRLVIKEMVLENFKSYGAKQSIGPFHQCFSSVVGPNGSGKSNVIDAMLFVFGKRANQVSS